MLIKTSAPASLMLLGEHAVLQGHLALVAAIDKRIYVELTPRADDSVLLFSALGDYQTTLADLTPKAPFQFVLATLASFQYSSGFELRIHSEFDSTKGLGSSAAVTVATTLAMLTWLSEPCDKMPLLLAVKKIIQSVQGSGSGADVAASIWGGVVAYRARPASVECFKVSFPLTVVYSGSKVPTPTVIQHVYKVFEKTPALLTQCLAAIGECAAAGYVALKTNNWQELGKMFKVQQGLMTAIQVNTPQLAAIVRKLEEDPAILGAKISGSGLGDCVIGLGKFLQPCSYEILPLAITNIGARIEKN
jgi:mevalonate kinase